MKSLRPVLISFVLIFALAGCSGTATSSEPSPTDTGLDESSQTPSPWAGSFTGTISGDPELVASAGLRSPKAFLEDEDGDTYVYFGERGGLAVGSAVVQRIEFDTARSGGLAAWLSLADLIGAPDGTAEWAVDPSAAPWATCPETAHPDAQEATDVVLDAEGRVESFTILVYEFTDWSLQEDTCEQFVLGRYPSSFVRED